MALFKDRIDRSPRAFGRARRGRAVERASVVVAGRRRARRGRAGVCGAARRARDRRAPSGRRARRLEKRVVGKIRTVGYKEQFNNINKK
jgi:hypothetical protein